MRPPQGMAPQAFWRVCQNTLHTRHTPDAQQWHRPRAGSSSYLMLCETFRNIAKFVSVYMGKKKKDQDSFRSISGAKLGKVDPAIFLLCDCFNPTTSWIPIVIRFNQKLKTFEKARKSFNETPARAQAKSNKIPEGAQTTPETHSENELCQPHVLALDTSTQDLPSSQKKTARCAESKLTRDENSIEKITLLVLDHNHEKVKTDRLS